MALSFLPQTIVSAEPLLGTGILYQVWNGEVKNIQGGIQNAEFRMRNVEKEKNEEFIQVVPQLGLWASGGSCDLCRFCGPGRCDGFCGPVFGRK
jgi:hypothetical protein